MTGSQIGRPPPRPFPLIPLIVVAALEFGLLFWFVGWDPGMYTLFVGLVVMPFATDWWEHRKKSADPFGGLMR